MHRLALSYLMEHWISAADRKPLVVRGARQVGKTWLVRQLASLTEKTLIEVNFEKSPQMVTLFSSNDPQQILMNLSVFMNKNMDLSSSLLFLDEIQAAPDILAKLRWFSEDFPQLPVIAAGSLLEFVLEEHTFSMPVGRISYLHLEPFSFEEFLLARGQDSLYNYLQKIEISQEIPEAIHGQFLNFFKEYLIVGGMPAVVARWIKDQSFLGIHQLQNDLLTTYRDDFSKYGDHISLTHLDEIMMSVPRRLGQKYVYSKVNSEINSQTIKKVLRLLNRARVCHRVSGCSANGVPLASEIKEKYFKQVFLDTGLCNGALGINYTQIQSVDELIFVHKGALAEQVVGQLLRTLNPFYVSPELYCWQRDAQGANAEIDYVIQHGGKIIPIEVKAGTTGSLKSLHVFMGSKKGEVALRIYSDRPNKVHVDGKDSLGNTLDYTLLSIPFYLMGQIHRFLES